MKKNSRILLLALAGSAVSTTGVPLSVVLQLPLGTTTPGKRSLVYFLHREKSVWLERHEGIIHVGITAQGRRRLSAQFPALLVREPLQSPEWQLLLLKQAPKNDLHFRSLAVLCKKFRVLRLARGVYAYPGPLPAELETQLTSLYAEDHLARCTVKDWVSGLDRPVIVSYYDIENLSAIYSSISSDLNRLLMPILPNKESSYRTISSICSVLDRLESALSSDCGLVQRFFPKTAFSSDLVDQVGSVMISIQLPE